MTDKYERFLDPKEFLAALTRENYPRLLPALSQELHSPALAEEILQSVFRDALRNHPLLIRPGSDPDKWCETEVRERLLLVRHRLSKRSPEEQALWEADMRCLEERFGHVDLTLLQNTRLSRQERAIFHMFYLQGYPVSDLAFLKNMSAEQVRRRLGHILEVLLGAGAP